MRDAALISAALRVEHYEMDGYGSVRTCAELLGRTETSKLLEQTLEGEKEAQKAHDDLAER